MAPTWRRTEPRRVSCPGADTCGLAVTQSRGLAKAIGDALETEGLADVGGVRINISGCMNSCGQHHVADIGFFGAERRAHGQSAPGYQMLLGGYVGQESVHFGDRALRLPAKNAPQATVRVIARFTAEREAGERFRDWLTRVGGAREVANGLRDLDAFPEPAIDPSFFVDFDETDPFTAEVGVSECANMTLVEPTPTAVLPLADALVVIDVANLEDPTLHYGEALAYVQGVRATVWLRRLEREPAVALELAVRAHHLKRWEIERRQYPEGRHGYLRWRRDNKAHQQRETTLLLNGAGVDTDTASEVGRLLLRSGLGSDRDVQLLEDVACLVFLETQFDELTAKLEHDRMVSVVAKTLKKMSPAAIEWATTVAYSTETRAVLEAAIATTSP